MSEPKPSSRFGLEEFHGNERYEVMRRLGSGGMGVVYEVYDRATRSRVALKTLTTGDATSIYRFKNEFRGLSDISHPNLVPLYELTNSDGLWFFTMELIEGDDLRSYVHRGRAPQDDIATEVLTEEALERRIPIAAKWVARSVDFERLRSCMRQLAEGLGALHAAGRLHRDIKPSNILVSDSGRVVVVDFGLSSAVAQVDVISDQTAVGTLGYMSPEQAGQEPLGPASDWYSVGCVLYELMTGVLPFVGRGDEVLMKKLTATPVDPRLVTSELPDDLAELCMALLRREPEDRPLGDSVLQSFASSRVQALGTNAFHPPLSRDVFVGRHRELDQLNETLAHVSAEGKPRAVLVHGSPGIGKSALLETFARRAGIEHDAVVLAGRCYERESVPFKAVDTIVDAIARHLNTLARDEVEALIPENPHALTRLFPVLKTVRPLARLRANRDALDPQVARRLALVALRNLLRSLAGRHRLIVCVDDFQWGDADSAVFLADLIGPPLPPALLMLVGYRRDDVHTSKALQVLQDRVDTVLGTADVQELPVERLSREEATELTMARFEGVASAQRQLVVDRVATESEGSPFFVEEMMRYLRSAIGQEAGGLERERITLRDTMLARVDSLAPEQRTLLDVVAVAGAPITEEIAFRASGLRVTDRSIVSVLRSARLVRSNGEGVVAKLESYHDRIRELLIETIEQPQLRETYRALAAAFEVAAASDAESIAEFHSRAGDIEAAAKHAIVAANRATDALAFNRAALFYRMALRAEFDEATSLELWTKLAMALLNAGRGEEAAEAFLTAAEMSSKSVALDHRRKAAQSLMRAGHVDRAVELFKEVLASVGLQFSTTNRRAIVNLLLWRGFLRLRGFSFRERDESQIAPEKLIKIDVCGSCGLAFGVNDSFRGAEFQTRHLVLALRAGEPRRVGQALSIEAAYRSLDGHKGREAAERLIERAKEIGDREGDPVAVGYATYSHGLTRYQCGEWREALELFDSAATILKRDCLGEQANACQAERLATDALFFLGEIKELTERVPEILQTAEARGDLHGVTDMRTGLLNSVWLANGRADRARSECNHGEEIWSERRFFLQHYYAALAHINIDIYEGKGVSALGRCDAMWGPLKRSFLLRVCVVRVQALFLRARSLLAAGIQDASIARGPSQRRVAKIARALGRERIGCAKPWKALLLGQLALSQGDGAKAISLLQESRAGLEREGMMLCYHACSRLLGRLLGGDEGQRMLDQAVVWARGQGIADPERFLRMMVPAL